MKKLSDISLIKSVDLKNGNRLRIENDDWGKFIRVVNEEDETLFGRLIIDEENLDQYVEQVKLRFS